MRPRRVPSLLRVVLVALLAFATLAPQAASAATTWNTVDLVDIDGASLAPADLAGKVVLVVNVASFCNYTPQYGALQALYDSHKDEGLVVLGVPCNQFGGQEPGSSKEIKNFCSSNYGITFPLLAKQHVNGAERSPLYAWLIGSEPGGGKDIGWNFEKFLVARDGSVVARFGSHVNPKDPALLTAVRYELARKATPQPTPTSTAR